LPLLTSVGLKRKNDALEKTQGDLASLIEKQDEANSKLTDAAIAEAGTKAAEAEAKAEGFRLNIAEANQQAEEAKDRAAQASLELAKFKAPRILTLEQQGRISEKLKPFAGKQFDVALTTDPETQDLLLQIETALKAAGWIEIDWTGAAVTFNRDKQPIAGLVVMSGVVVQMHADQVPELWKAAESLAII
jgi:hypothetical protein